MGQRVVKPGPKEVPQTRPTNEYKFLLLGSGESGKSTFHKQLRIILGETGFLQKESGIYVNTIYANILFTIYSISTYLKKNNIAVDDSCSKAISLINDICSNDNNLLIKGAEIYTADVHNAVKLCWKQSAFRDSLNACRTEYHIFYGAEYFLNDLDRLTPPKFIPNTEDSLRCRRKTTGVVEFKCTPTLNGKQYSMNIVDVGGQRSERRKWPSFYEGVTALMFVCSLNEFDQKCYEDDTTNRMIESMDLFDQETNGSFKDRPVILLLNKVDLFKEKIKKSDLKGTFSDFGGGQDSEAAIEYIKGKFLATNKFAPDRIHPFLTCATDKDIVQASFDNILKLVADGKLEVKK
jgi:guanine nucleotide-binding protein G(i) subunit alpha